MAQTEEEIFLDALIALLESRRKVDTSNLIPVTQLTPSQKSHFATILKLCSAELLKRGRPREAETLQHVLNISLESKFHGGLGLSPTTTLTAEEREEVTFQAHAWLQALNSEDEARKMLGPLTGRQAGRRPMTLSQKIFAQHAIGKIAAEGLEVLDLVTVIVDWVISSELAWSLLLPLMEKAGAKDVFRNDRFWLAGDHRVDPRNYNTPTSKKLIESTAKAQKDHRLVDYKGNNYTIIHTEFVRERAEPGMLVVGADSHTCSAGAVGALSIGLGAEDVVIPLMTGETWFKIPECISIVFTGKPLPGIGGKDVILSILKDLKRNTVAASRIVEFSGPGLQHLSIDARFAICNMCTEFGAVTGIFVPDEVTYNYVSKRKLKRHRSSNLYFRPDPDAWYAQTFTINLSLIKPYIALYPSPDNVVPVTSQLGKKLDGCFIGACTTTEEDLVLAGLVLKAGNAKGLVKKEGNRHVTPGSMPIVDLLGKLGLLEEYKKAGFTQGAPGCSYCVGVADTAAPGSVWLSSQNRNFPNRMGPGSFANIAAAVTVAASSFSMEVCDPTALLAEIDMDTFEKYKEISKGANAQRASKHPEIRYMEPNYEQRAPSTTITHQRSASMQSTKYPVIKSRVTRLGDFVDTDALSPSEFLLTATTNEQLAEHCLEHTNPDFRSKVKAGQRVVVAGRAFGVGSSRETAPRALKGLNVECIIARSFAFIYARNQPNIGILGIVLDDDEFHELATEGEKIEIDQTERKVRVQGKEFGFKLEDMEIKLVENGGMNASYRKYGKVLFEKLMGTDEEVPVMGHGPDDGPDVIPRLQW